MAAGSGSDGPSSSATWPSALTSVFASSITVEYASVSRAGLPVMVPVTPYVEDGQQTLDVSTGLTYPAKAERARRNPKVALLFSDSVGAGLAEPPVVLVQGLATVRDSELQANTDRYVRLAMAKLPDAYQGQPRFVLRKLSAYFARIWICVTPMRMWWWPSRALDREPDEWTAPAGVVAPLSDPRPAGKQPPAWLDPPRDWRVVARDALVRLEQRDLAWVGADGFPMAVPITGLEQVEDGFRLALGPHAPGSPKGPATLTLHGHPAAFTGQENHTFVGSLHRTGDEYGFRVDRVLADVSLTGNRLVSTVGFLRKVTRLHERLRSEAARRGQPVPRVRFPDDT